MVKEIKFQLCSFNDLLESLPEEERSENVVSNLHIVYANEIIRMLDYAHTAFNPFVRLLSFEKNGDQFISKFWVNDLALSEKETYNFHGQNTSQWVYAGCILVDNGEVSTHH